MGFPRGCQAIVRAGRGSEQLRAARKGLGKDWGRNVRVIKNNGEQWLGGCTSINVNRFNRSMVGRGVAMGVIAAILKMGVFSKV